MTTRLGIGVAERVVAGVGRSIAKVDAEPKVRGAFEYASDLWAEDMLFGATLRSPHAAAEIRGIDLGEGIAMPGVHAALTAADIPGKLTFGLEFSDQPGLASGVVRYAGEPVAILAADDPELAHQAVRRIRVAYAPAEPVVDMVRALDPGSPKVHPFGNVLRHVHIEHGDPAAEAEVWVEGYYETGMQDNAPLGPEGGLAIPCADGGVELRVNTQWLHVDRQQLAACLKLPEEKVRITLSGMGGAFGAREDIHLQLHACMLALATGRPVKMSYGREESFLGHKHRHPARIWMRTGATREGRLVNVRARFLLDGGAYASSSPAVVANASSFAAGPYEVPNALIDGTAMYTNNPPCGAMRGFGAPQLCVAHEAQMDKLAAHLGLDAVELRLRNAVGTGSTLPTGQVIHGAAPVRELIERCTAVPLPEAEPATGRDPIGYPGGAGNVSRGERLRRGVGLAVGYKNVGYSEGFDDAADARVRLRRGPDLPVAELHTAAVECGQGLHTVLTQIVRTELGVDEVRIAEADTAVGSAGSTSASRQTVMAGGAAQLACRQVLAKLAERARAAGAPVGEPAALTAEGGWLAADGVPVATLDDLLDEPVDCTATYHHRPTTGFDPSGQGDIHVMFAFAAERAVVEVDLELGLVRVLQVACALDVGKAINPAGVEAQVEGGTAMGLGLALMEGIQLDQGRMRNASFTDYLIPTILDSPPIVSVIVEEPEPGTPYGAKGIGESATIVATAAVAAALRDATGIELNRVPVAPDDLVGLRRPATANGWPPNPDVPWQTPIPELAGLGAGQQELMT